MLLSLLFACGVIAQHGADNGTSNGTFTNPILDKVGADPWVIQHEGWYYLTYSLGTNITIYRSKVLTDWNHADSMVVLNPGEGLDYSYDLWAPELHQIDDRWYIIFTADSDPDNPPPETEMLCDWNCPAVNHRMFVLEGSLVDPWNNYTMKGMLNTYDQFAIDGTYFQHSTGLYHVYSCWYEAYISWPSMLCISKMSSPLNVSSPLSERAIISVPTQPWEKTPYGRLNNIRLSSNEAPQQLINPYTSQQFIIYSAARSDNANYCLGQLELVGTDPMNAQDWVKHDGCVFYQNKPEQAYGVGHASFTTAGDENWIVYHGMRDPKNGWDARTIRAQQFDWNPDGTPKFPRPGYGPYPAPQSL